MSYYHKHTNLPMKMLESIGKEGWYGHHTYYFGVDNGAFDRAQLRSAASWAWSMAAHNSKMSLICLEAFGLAAGEHVLRLAPREAIHIDLIAIADNPGLFE